MDERRRITIRGTVQGVGFRPYVYGLAVAHQLRGFVQNRLGDVLVEVEGKPDALARFLERLPFGAPTLARIDDLTCEPLSPVGEHDFRIAPSDSRHPGRLAFPADAATCDDCLAELRDPRDRRFRYPFLNCTHCGPRLTIVRGAPYDRERTTMAPFPMCPECRREYHDPQSRRFHAQPTACPRCGPRLQLCTAGGARLDASDPLDGFRAAILAGQIGALKGLGGYHLVCDATQAAAVAELRRRKERDEKPFALMAADEAVAAEICDLSEAERTLLTSWRRPIVLLRRRTDSRIPIADAVAPANPFLGVMLPYTPLHHLLMDAVERRPLVMTSGNRRDEPIAYRDEDAREALADIADVMLTHNREIHVRCDDSVTRMVAGVEQPIRRARGRAPEPIALPVSCPCPILAVGGSLKATFALGQDRFAIVSHHLGDLEHLAACRAFQSDVALYQQLFDIDPDCLVHDLHPDYASTRFAMSAAEGKRPRRRLAVQHHHAHLASCLAENGLDAAAIGVTWDGTGLGTDGTIWGGEFLVGDLRQFRRAAHLRPVPMPGGDRAVKEPWRMAAAHLLDAGRDFDSLDLPISSQEQRTLAAMIRQRIHSPLTSSMGRLFDAAAALIGVRERVTYEGQAAVELEWLASEVEPQPPYPWELSGDELDVRPLIRALVADVRRRLDRRILARRFHASLTEMIVVVCRRLRDETGLNRVALSGGVFLNALLTSDAAQRLGDEGFEVYRHRQVPPNDGGLSLGQLAIAAAQLSEERQTSSQTAT